MSNNTIRLLFLFCISLISITSQASDNRYIGGIPISIDQNITFNFNIASQGSRGATAWYNDDIAIVVEGADSSVFDRATMEKIVALMLNSKRSFEDFTGIRNLPLNGHYKSIPTIQVPRDNNGAGGLAHHGSFGISVGRGFFDRFYERVRSGNTTIDQVWLYEMNRNYYKPGASGWNGWIDWAMDGQNSNYGFWTVGFNNAAAIWIVDDLGVGLNYHGRNRDQFRAGFDSDLNTYLNNTSYNFENVWTSRLLPWRHQTVNNLMSGALLRWYDNHGGKPFIQRLYREIENNPRLRDRFDFQRARDNWYRIVSRASRTNQESHFENTLRWSISQKAKNTIRTEFPNNNVNIVIEAERARLFGQMKKGNDSNASGGQFIHTENQSRTFTLSTARNLL